MSCNEHFGVFEKPHHMAKRKNRENYARDT